MHTSGPLTVPQQTFRNISEACNGSQRFRKLPTGKNRNKVPCHLFLTETAWICMGCKRHACEVNRDKKL